MTMEEYRASLISLMFEECNTVKMINHDHLVQNHAQISAGNEVFSNLEKELSGFSVELNANQQSALKYGFVNGMRMGNIRGFYDTGLLLNANKGKTGIAFFTLGLSQREKNNSTDQPITYTAICQSILNLQDSGSFLLTLPDTHFSCKQDKIMFIEAGHTIMDAMKVVRKHLLEKNPVARSVFYENYCRLADAVYSAFYASNYEETGKWIDALCEYATSNQENGYLVPESLRIILYAAQDDYKKAKSYLESSYRIKEEKGVPFKRKVA